MGKDLSRRKGASTAQSKSVGSDAPNNKRTRRRPPAGRTQRAKEQKGYFDFHTRKDAESSAYWSSLPVIAETKVEPVEANPDLIQFDDEDYADNRDYYGQLLENVKKAMKTKLSSREFMAIQLLRQGFTYDKISLNMGIRKTSVQNLIVRARQKLLPYLSNE